MKAKEYAEHYNALRNGGDGRGAIIEVLNGFAAETVELVKIRHVSTDAGVVAILKEQDLKWRAFVRKAGDPSIKPDGWLRLNIARVPDLKRYFPEVK